MKKALLAVAAAMIALTAATGLPALARRRAAAGMPASACKGSGAHSATSSPSPPPTICAALRPAIAGSAPATTPC